MRMCCNIKACLLPGWHDRQARRASRAELSVQERDMSMVTRQRLHTLLVCTCEHQRSEHQDSCVRLYHSHKQIDAHGNAAALPEGLAGLTR